MMYPIDIEKRFSVIGRAAWQCWRAADIIDADAEKTIAVQQLPKPQAGNGSGSDGVTRDQLHQIGLAFCTGLLVDAMQMALNRLVRDAWRAARRLRRSDDARQHWRE
jgi:hypothetical protein